MFVDAIYLRSVFFSGPCPDVDVRILLQRSVGTVTRPIRIISKIHHRPFPYMTVSHRSLGPRWEIRRRDIITNTQRTTEICVF